MTDKIPNILKVRSNEGLTLNQNPKISVITTSFNLAKFIEDTMNSVENQTTRDYEHIVIDGASKDESLSILKKYPHIKLISEKDTGYPDAFWKGVKMARGKYIIQVPVTDCLSDINWLKTCLDILDKNPDISLVWGLRGKVNEKSEEIEFKQKFLENPPPTEEKFFSYFLKTAFVYPEGNLCVRKEVLEKCYPTLSELEANNNILDWLEFSYRFNCLGFIAKYVPIVASYGRVHDNQLGEQLGSGGRLKRQYKNYWAKIRKYRNNLILGKTKHHFIDSNGHKVANRIFDKKDFIKDYVLYLMTDGLKKYKKYFLPQKYFLYFKKLIVKTNFFRE